MKIEVVSVGVFQSNCYLIVDEASNDAIVIDPGDEPDRILAFIKGMGVTPSLILLTHAHLDHIMAVRHVKETYNIPVRLHEGDQFIYDDLVFQAERFGREVDDPLPIDQNIAESDTLSFRGTEISVMHTPGHSPGGVSFLLSSSPQVLFSGDALFAGSIGRTDLPGGNHQLLIDSIKNRLLTLPPSTIVFPGHGPSTTIDHERRTNPFLI